MMDEPFRDKYEVLKKTEKWPWKGCRKVDRKAGTKV